MSLFASNFLAYSRAEEPVPLVNDAFIAPDVPRGLYRFAPVHEPGYYETSEYMIGSIVVGIVFLESNGAIDLSTEDWTSTEESAVIDEITAGLTWWAGQNPSGGVSFTYDIHYRVPTSYEPISRPAFPNQRLWISEAMTYLGYPLVVSYFQQVLDYINAIRGTYGTDWAYAMFIVDSSADPDGKFADNYFAYAYLGGPFLVMTYDNDGYGISNMDYVAAHETGHIFYATDEYDPPPNEYSGYLNVPDVDGSGCLMETPLSWKLSGGPPDWAPPYGLVGTWGQVGWRDTDGDGIQDIVDTFPASTLNPYVPDPTTNVILTYTGTVCEQPYPNNNPDGTGRDVTINTIASEEFRVDGGPWSPATAADGAFDEEFEDFTFTTPSLSPGTHVIEVQGINSLGNIEGPPYASDNITIVTFYIVSVSSNPSAIGATFQLSLDSPHPYPNNYDNSWALTIPGATQVRVHFSRIDVESGWDYVYVYDGGDSLINSYTGYYVDVWSSYASGNTIKIRLETDISITDWGFQIDVIDAGGASISSFQVVCESIVYLDNPPSSGDCYTITKGPDPPSYIFDHWTVNGITIPSGSSFTVDRDLNVVAYYIATYTITVQTSGLMSSSYTTHVYVDGVDQGPPYLWDGASRSFTFDTGTTHTVSVNEYVDGPPDTRYHCATYSLLVSGDETITFTYHVEYRVTVGTSGLDASCLTPLYIDGSNVGAINDGAPWTGWLDGGSYSFSVDQYVSGPSGTRFHCTDYTRTITITSPQSIVFAYDTEYFLTVNTNPSGLDAPTGEGWYDDGASAPISVSSVLGFTFQYWYLDGQSETPYSYSMSTTVIMNAPHTATAYYKATSTITVSCNPTSISYGSSTTISGDINPDHSGVLVGLSYSLDGGSTWEVFLVVKTNSTGGYSVTWIPPYPLTYVIKAYWEGDADHAGAMSSPATLTVSGTMPPQPSLLITLPDASFSREETATITVTVFNPTSTVLDTTLYVQITEPYGYYHFDSTPIVVDANSFASYIFTWIISSEASVGTYTIEAGLIPPLLTAYDADYFEVK